jgi:ubiquitin-protein ligase
MRRLRNDLAALEKLQSESSVFRFKAQGNPPHIYHIVLKGKSLWRVRGQAQLLLDSHRIEVKLGASYPRTMPELRWVTPIYHPNISEIGMVCLGGYGTHWVPSIQLDELCNMLWDMARYHNYDIRSPYNRDAALWVASQTTFLFPTDSRPLRDLRAAMGRIEPHTNSQSDGDHAKSGTAPASSSTPTPGTAEVEARAPARVREFMKRYRTLFTKSTAVETRVAAPSIGPELVSAEVNLRGSEPPEPPQFAPEADDEEIVLLESDSVPEPANSSFRHDDGITFIE